MCCCQVCVRGFPLSIRVQADACESPGWWGQLQIPQKLSSGSGSLVQTSWIAAADAGATPWQSTVSLRWDGDLAACLFLFCDLLALGFLLCFQTKQNLAQLLLRQHRRKSVVTCWSSRAHLVLSLRHFQLFKMGASYLWVRTTVPQSQLWFQFLGTLKDHFQLPSLLALTWKISACRVKVGFLT